MAGNPTTTRVRHSIGDIVAALTILDVVWLFARSGPPPVGGEEEKINAANASLY